ncbi:hypothetical protein PUN28_019920 [Cardiocondyla obscurior]|uniref:Uncharacterized protein n=1 Tax=Cardiocondyla obscurior TaxID=286306 RepID=A0AAW2EC15_9HYME
MVKHSSSKTQRNAPVRETLRRDSTVIPFITAFHFFEKKSVKPGNSGKSRRGENLKEWKCRPRCFAISVCSPMRDILLV